MAKPAPPLNLSTWPQPNPEIEAALGRFLIAWAIVEQQLDFTIHEITRLDWDLSHAIAANLGTKAKLDMIQALTHCMKEVLSPATVSEVDQVAAATGNATSEIRNFLIHGQPWQLTLPDGDVDFWAKFAARKFGVRGKGVTFTPDFIEAQTDEVKRLIDQWIAARASLQEHIDIWEMVKKTEMRDE